MYSGYLDLKNPKKKLHYLFLESQNDPNTDPLILWLNGGPGCSSLLGWAQEHGPAIFEENSTKFTNNPYSWNKRANIIYLESPSNVGFSYNESDMEQDLYVDDEISGQENLEAILSFFQQYINFKNNDFYISGESYAGIYVPTLAYKIIEHNSKTASSLRINLKGIMVGNGVTDWSVDTEPALIDFAYSHALYSPELRNEYLNVCVKNIDENKCAIAKGKIFTYVSKVNIYDIYRKCSPPNEIGRLLNNKSVYNYTPWLFNDDNISNSHIFLAARKKLKETPPCVDSTGPDSYFNRLDVKIALNVRTDLSWGMCSDTVGQHYNIGKKGSYYIYPTLLENKIRILIYSGDTDGAVPVNGTQKWISNLGLEVIKPWRSWKCNDGDMVSGYVTEYKGLTFVTVKGTGHMVPQWKPEEAYYMLSRFLEGSEL